MTQSIEDFTRLQFNRLQSQQNRSTNQNLRTVNRLQLPKIGIDRSSTAKTTMDGDVELTQNEWTSIMFVRHRAITGSAMAIAYVCGTAIRHGPIILRVQCDYNDINSHFIKVYNTAPCAPLFFVFNVPISGSYLYYLQIATLSSETGDDADRIIASQEYPKYLQVCDI